MYKVMRLAAVSVGCCLMVFVAHACGMQAEESANGVGRAERSCEDIREARRQLYEVIEEQNEEDLVALITHHAIDVNKVGEGEVVSPFLYAIQHSTVSIVQHLIAICADVNRETDIVEGVGEYTSVTPLARAVFVNRAGMAQVLLEHGAEIPSLSKSDSCYDLSDLLRQADRHKNYDMIELLLTDNADVCARDSRGRTLLPCVLHNGIVKRAVNPETIRRLILVGVPIDDVEQKQWSSKVCTVVERALVEKEQSMVNLGLFERLFDNGLNQYLIQTPLEQIFDDYEADMPINVYLKRQLKHSKRCLESACDLVKAIVLVPLGITVVIAELVCDFIYFGDTNPVLLLRAERSHMASEQLARD